MDGTLGYDLLYTNMAPTGTVTITTNGTQIFTAAYSGGSHSLVMSDTNAVSPVTIVTRWSFGDIFSELGVQSVARTNIVATDSHLKLVGIESDSNRVNGTGTTLLSGENPPQTKVRLYDPGFSSANSNKMIYLDWSNPSGRIISVGGQTNRLSFA